MKSNRRHIIFKLASLLKPEQEDPENNLKSDVIEIKEDKVEIRKSFVAQFAENQNHNQKLFIQFLSSVLFVIIGFAFVYSNTATKSGIAVYNTKTEKGSNLIIPIYIQDSLKSINKLESDSPKMQIDSIRIYPDVANVKKNMDGAILSFSVSNLLGIYLFAEIVLLILLTIILHTGYTYRRDQQVVYRIRQTSLKGPDYFKIFGKKSYDPLNKNAYDFLPNFNLIIFMAIF
ncbi:MAG: hypothetical protein IPJ02_01625 [Chitinophagaceae bacterium]|nr:hypothetical protein [Chitinophagaceae bacterium]